MGKLIRNHQHFVLNHLRIAQKMYGPKFGHMQ